MASISKFISQNNTLLNQFISPKHCLIKLQMQITAELQNLFLLKKATLVGADQNASRCIWINFSYPEKDDFSFDGQALITSLLHSLIESNQPSIR